MAAIVLVHGSHCGGWVWQKLAPLLREAGHQVFTPTLTGLSDRSHLDSQPINLSTHIADISNLIFYENLTDVILVGNSYGGMVITGVAAKSPEWIKSLVYLDAYLPDPGQSEMDLWPPKMRETIFEEMSAHKSVRMPPSPTVFGINDPALSQWLIERFTPQPLATYLEPVPEGNNKMAATNHLYIHCTGSPETTTPVFAKFATKARVAGWPVRELAAGHLAMLTAPQEVASILISFSQKFKKI